MIEDDYDNEQCKDVFAYFGRAFYAASVFEAGLANALLHLDFLEKAKQKILMLRPKNFDRNQYEADFDAYSESQFRLTLGNLIKRARAINHFTESEMSLIADSKLIRDKLAHNYFRENAEKFARRKGRDKMIQELEGYHDIFRKTDEIVSMSMRMIMDRNGISQEMIEAEMTKIANDIESDE